jgi:hypothetical protein
VLALIKRLYSVGARFSPSFFFFLPFLPFPESPPSACASAGGSASNLGVSPLSSAPRSVEPALLAARPRS